MRILITGICGFTGSTLALGLLDEAPPGQITITGIDNLSRAGSWLNWERLKKRGVRLQHGDVRQASDLKAVGPVDWVLDAAANPSVLAGIDGKGSSRQLLENNLLGTINLLELCKEAGAGFVLLSTSRVYSIEALSNLKITAEAARFVPAHDQSWPAGISTKGVSEQAPICAPISLYGASKLASETLSLEYGSTFYFPVWVNRCGVLAGAGQFGRADQGIFSFWINAWQKREPLRYIGFGGTGYQVRDCLHPRDLAQIIVRQMNTSDGKLPKVCNLSGGLDHSMSLAELSRWCAQRFGQHDIASDSGNRTYDVPWLVLDSTLARSIWKWEAQTKLEDILDEIAAHAEANPDWLHLSSN